MIHFNIPVYMEDRHEFQTIYVELQAFKTTEEKGFLFVCFLLFCLLFTLQILCPLSPVYPLTVPYPTPPPHTPVSTRISPLPTQPDP